MLFIVGKIMIFNTYFINLFIIIFFLIHREGQFKKDFRGEGDSVGKPAACIYSCSNRSNRIRDSLLYCKKPYDIIFLKTFGTDLNVDDIVEIVSGSLRTTTRR